MLAVAGNGLALQYCHPPGYLPDVGTYRATISLFHCVPWTLKQLWNASNVEKPEGLFRRWACLASSLKMEGSTIHLFNLLSVNFSEWWLVTDGSWRVQKWIGIFKSNPEWDIQQIVFLGLNARNKKKKKIFHRRTHFIDLMKLNQCFYNSV